MTVLTFLCAAGACQYCAGDDDGPLRCEHSCHGKPQPETVPSWDPPEPDAPACRVCRDTGKAEVPYSDGDGLHDVCDEACPACDAPYPDSASGSTEDPWAAPAPY